jgi:oligoribonuclease NrnB/cAMP/cGMP phosphodiesterase (DHH superfamily)
MAETTKPLCIYHGHCDDGFAAAWAVRHARGPDAFEFYPGVYQQDPPDVTGRHVLLVDFSYKRPVLLEMARQALSVTILDHHKTAAEDLADFPPPATWPSASAQPAPIAALFDMNRSGAGLAWDFFHPDQPRPLFIEYIEDRDLWRKQLPGGDEFTIALRSHPQDFETWDQLVQQGAVALIEEGAAIQRYYRRRVEELKRSAYETTIAGAPCWIANAPYFAASEVAGELAERGHGFGACYFEVSEGRWQYSLRARGDFDVSEIARKFGGGGHKGAAGFTSDGPIHRPPGRLA